MRAYYKPVDVERLRTLVAVTVLGQAPKKHRVVRIPFEPVPGEIDPDKTWRKVRGGWEVDDPTILEVDFDVEELLDHTGNDELAGAYIKDLGLGSA